MAGKTTIRDVARLAGVSVATVSRVLNDKPDVDAATRVRIQRIMDEQRFVPSLAGTGLAGGRTGLVGMLLPSLTWAIMSPIMSGVADVIEQTAHELVLYGHSHRQERGEVIQRIIDVKLIEGLIAVYPEGAAFAGDTAQADEHISERLGQLHLQGFPVVVIDDQHTHDAIPWISSDSRGGAVQAVRHLRSLGHTRIAHITGPMAYLCSLERLAGYREALLEASLAVDPDLVIAGNFTASSGRAAMDRLLTLSAPPTAVFAANDDMAFGVLAAARHHGLHVPRDVAVVGFDDAGPAASAKPSLTTVRQPFYDMGRQAAATLVARLEAEPRAHAASRPSRYQPGPSSLIAGAAVEPTAVSRITVPVQLIERDSTLALQAVTADR